MIFFPYLLFSLTFSLFPHSLYSSQRALLSLPLISYVPLYLRVLNNRFLLLGIVSQLTSFPYLCCNYFSDVSSNTTFGGKKKSLEGVRAENGKIVKAALDMRYWDSLDWCRDCREGRKNTYTNLSLMSMCPCWSIQWAVLFSHLTFQKIWHSLPPLLPHSSVVLLLVFCCCCVFEWCILLVAFLSG